MMSKLCNHFIAIATKYCGHSCGCNCSSFCPRPGIPMKLASTTMASDNRMHWFRPTTSVGMAAGRAEQEMLPQMMAAADLITAAAIAIPVTGILALKWRDLMLHAFDPAQAQPLTWLSAIARNGAIDSLRRGQTQPQTVSLTRDDDEAEDTAVEASDDVDPLALLQPERLSNATEREAIDQLTAGHASPAEYYVDLLAQGMARIALPFDRALRPGGFASVTIKAGTMVAPVLPESAVLSDALDAVGVRDQAMKPQIRWCISIWTIRKSLAIKVRIKDSHCFYPKAAIARTCCTFQQNCRPSIKGSPCRR